jgi:hypothetical protein
MSHVYESATMRILDWFHHAERDLIGKDVTLFNKASGTVLALKLDDMHGICFTMDHNIKRRWHPVSSIKTKER